MKTKHFLFAFLTLFIFAACEKEEYSQPTDDFFSTTSENITKESDEEGLSCVTHLIAGQNINVGEVQVSNDGTYFYVSYVITNSQWEIVDIHLAVSTDSPGTGEWMTKRWQNRSGNPAPGRFPYQFDDGDLNNGTWSIAIPLSEIGPNGAETGDQVCIGAHAVVRKTSGSDAGGTETAWGAGTRFVERGNWATYFCCTINEEPDPTPEPVIIFGATSNGLDGVRALYEINMNTQVETLIFEVPQTGGSFAPNGLAFDEENNRLYYAVGNKLWFYDRSSGDNTLAGTIASNSFGAVFAGGKYWYVRNGTSNMYAVSFDADGLIISGNNTAFESNFAGIALDFGDIAYDAVTNVIYGSTVNANAQFFKYDLSEDAGNRYSNLGSARSGMQLALVEDGTLYGHVTGDNEFYEVNKDADEAPVLLFESIYRYNDLAPGPKASK